MRDIRLTRNFWLHEFEVSREAAIAGLDNQVPRDLMPNITKLARALQATRDALSEEAGRDCPITVTSGYRAPVVNALPGVGGSIGSHHLQGGAADWICPSFGTPFEVCTFLADRMEELGWEQLIYEWSWVHSSVLPVKAINRVISRDSKGWALGITETRGLA